MPRPGGPAAGVVLPITAEFGASARARGTAVRLPNGLLLTAAHVVDEASLRESLCRRGRWPGEDAPYLSRLSVLVDGQDIPGARVAIGRSTFQPLSCELAYRDGADIAVLRLPAPPAGPVAARPAPEPCGEEPQPGQAVVVVTRDRRLRASIGGTARESIPALGSYAVLSARLEEGESGGGVFDSASGCLIGIVSQRDPENPDRTWLVRAPVIRAFLAAMD